jgi:hypothetical protein
LVQVKICGLTDPDTVRRAAEAGADWIGFVFFERSPRAVTPEAVETLLLSIGDATPVALMVDPDDALLTIRTMRPVLRAKRHALLDRLPEQAVDGAAIAFADTGHEVLVAAGGRLLRQAEEPQRLRIGIDAVSIQMQRPVADAGDGRCRAGPRTGLDHRPIVASHVRGIPGHSDHLARPVSSLAIHDTARRDQVLAAIRPDHLVLLFPWRAVCQSQRSLQSLETLGLVAEARHRHRTHQARTSTAEWPA